MAFPVPHYISPDEYLALERAADQKSEYINGEVFAMSGGSFAHSTLCANLILEIGLALKGTPCAVKTSDLRISIPDAGLYTYPDVSVVCGEPEFSDEFLDTLLNPALLVEVLSPSSEAYDRGVKFAHYQRIASLKEYVLVAQDRVRVERYVREGEAWKYFRYEGLNAALTLCCVEDDIPLAALYERVTLPERPVW
ncbi:MAG: Uma2 family endonuclease [Actinomycetota bacterium]